MRRKHVAILIEPFLSLILSGEKKIESRFGMVRCAPYGRVTPGDTILLKESGGPIRGSFVAGEVQDIELDAASLRKIKHKYSKGICSSADPKFWQDRSKKKYATLICVTDVIRFSHPRKFSHRGRSGWVVVR